MKLAARFEEWRRGLAIARRFGSDIRPHGWSLVLVGLVTLAGVGAELLRPWPIKWIIDQALNHKHHPTLAPESIILWGALAAVALVLLDCGCDYAAALLTNRISQAVARTIRLRVFEHLSRLSPAFFARYKSGDLLVRLMGDVPLVRAMLVDSAVAVITRGLLIVGTLTMMVVLDARLTILVVGLIPLCMLSVWWISRQLHVAARKQRAKEGELADYLHEAIAANSLIQSLGASSAVGERFARSNRSATRAELKASRLSAQLSVSIETIFGVCTAAALFFMRARGHADHRTARSCSSPTCAAPVEAGARHRQAHRQAFQGHGQRRAAAGGPRRARRGRLRARSRGKLAAAGRALLRAGQLRYRPGVGMPRDQRAWRAR